MAETETEQGILEGPNDETKMEAEEHQPPERALVVSSDERVNDQTLEMNIEEDQCFEQLRRNSVGLVSKAEAKVEAKLQTDADTRSRIDVEACFESHEIGGSDKDIEASSPKLPDIKNKDAVAGKKNLSGAQKRKLWKNALPNSYNNYIKEDEGLVHRIIVEGPENIQSSATDDTRIEETEELKTNLCPKTRPDDLGDIHLDDETSEKSSCAGSVVNDDDKSSCAEAEKLERLRKERLEKMQQSFQHFLATSVNGTDGKRSMGSNESVTKSLSETEESNDHSGEASHSHINQSLNCNAEEQTVTGIIKNNNTNNHNDRKRHNVDYAYKWKKPRKASWTGETPGLLSLPPGSIPLSELVSGAIQLAPGSIPLSELASGAIQLSTRLPYEVKQNLTAAQEMLKKSVMMMKNPFFDFVQQESSEAGDCGRGRGESRQWSSDKRNNNFSNTRSNSFQDSRNKDFSTRHSNFSNRRNNDFSIRNNKFANTRNSNFSNYSKNNSRNNSGNWMKEKTIEKVNNSKGNEECGINYLFDY